MDKTVLVSQAQALTEILDKTSIMPKAVMWVHFNDTDMWKLWIVPSQPMQKPEFYRVMAEAISGNRDQLHGIDIGSTEMIPENHPAMAGMNGMIRVEGISDVEFRGNRFNGYYLPDGLIIRMTL